MSSKIKNSSLLAKYTLQYKRKPRSRVFAPLAETYRKLGMYEDAFKILKDGIKHNPSYVLGYIVLANCYYDQQNYELAYNTIRPFVSDNLDNLTLQKLFAQTCINLGYLEEALETLNIFYYLTQEMSM
jgi:tetratricopeptide (TPR) repeat protein